MKEIKSSNIKKIVWIVFLIAWMGLIFYFSSQPSEQSTQVSEGVVQKILKLLNIEFSDHFIRKTAHFCVYMVLGGILFKTIEVYKNSREPLIAIGGCAIYAVSDELHQFFVPGRSCMFADMLLDTAGSATSICLIMLLYYFLKNKKTKIGNAGEESFDES